MQPATSLIAAGQSLQEMITQMERMDDVMSYKEEREPEANWKRRRFLSAGAYAAPYLP